MVPEELNRRICIGTESVDGRKNSCASKSQAKKRTSPSAATPPVIPSENCCDPCCPAKPFQITLGSRVWFTQGNADDEIQDGAGLNQFKFRDLEATVYEFNIDTVLLNRFNKAMGVFAQKTTKVTVEAGKTIDVKF